MKTLTESIKNSMYTPKYANGSDIDIKTDDMKDKVFIIIKPGFEKYNWKIIDIFQKAGFEYARMKATKLTLKQAKDIYKIHKNEDFYKALCEYMSSGISTGILFEKKSSNPDKIFKEVDKLKDEIRKKWSESDMRNVMHSSDSYENMLLESQYYFGI